MPVLSESQTVFTVDGTKAVRLAVPDGQAVTVFNTGNTVYYDNVDTVTSSSNDGSIASAASATFTSPQFLICAQGVQSSIVAIGAEGWAGDLRISDDVTVVDTTTQTGVITPSAGIAPVAQPASIYATLPATATSGTDTAFADGTTFLTSVFVPYNMTVTGIGYLVGSVGGTDKVIVRIYSSAGTLLASSTTASSGTTAGTAAQVQEIALTSTYAAVGPNRYFIAVSANGNTAKLRTVAAHTGAKTLSGSVALTHAATTAITPPTAFAADKAPFAYLY